jgi:hypothetical protein
LTRPRGLAVRQDFAAGERKAASRGKLLPERRADAHQRFDPWLDKTGCGEQRAHVTPDRMPSSDRACRPGNEPFDGSLGTTFIAIARPAFAQRPVDVLPFGLDSPGARTVLIAVPRHKPCYCFNCELDCASGGVYGRSLCRQANFSLHLLKLAKLQRHAAQRYGVAPRRNLNTIQAGGL